MSCEVAYIFAVYRVHFLPKVIMCKGIVTIYIKITICNIFCTIFHYEYYSHCSFWARIAVCRSVTYRYRDPHGNCTTINATYFAGPQGGCIWFKPCISNNPRVVVMLQGQQSVNGNVNEISMSISNYRNNILLGLHLWNRYTVTPSYTLMIPFDRNKNHPHQQTKAPQEELSVIDCLWFQTWSSLDCRIVYNCKVFSIM